MSEYVLSAEGSTGKKYHDALLYRQTTDGSATEVTFDGTAPSSSNRFFITEDTAFFCRVNIIARETSGADFASYMRYLIIENTGGTTALSGSVTTLGSDLGSNAGAPPAGWGGPTITADNTNDSLKVDVTGQAATTINWLVKVDAIEVD